MDHDIFVRVSAAFREGTKMPVRAARLVFLGSVLAGLLGCAPSPLDPDVATDGPKADGPNADGPNVDRTRCSGEAGYCVQGGPLGDGVVCGDFAMPSTCIGDQWTCPSGMVETRSCTCAFPGMPGCTICTANGWVCPDAGVDGNAMSAEAGTDGAIDHRAPKPGENLRCLPNGDGGASPDGSPDVATD